MGILQQQQQHQNRFCIVYHLLTRIYNIFNIYIITITIVLATIKTIFVYISLARLYSRTFIPFLIRNSSNWQLSYFWACDFQCCCFLAWKYIFLYSACSLPITLLRYSVSANYMPRFLGADFVHIKYYTAFRSYINPVKDLARRHFGRRLFLLTIYINILHSRHKTLSQSLPL